MLFHKKCSMFLAIVTINLAACAYATSPTSLQPQPSLKFNLEESPDWIICEIKEASLLEVTARQNGAIGKAICQNDVHELDIIAGHKIEVGETYLIFNQNADFLLLPNYSFPSDHIKVPDGFIEASKLGRISGGLRIVVVRINQSSETYVMVPRVWESPVKNYAGVGAVKRDHSIILPCNTEHCNTNEIGYYLVPVVEVLRKKGTE